MTWYNRARCCLSLREGDQLYIGNAFPDKRPVRCVSVPFNGRVDKKGWKWRNWSDGLVKRRQVEVELLMLKLKREKRNMTEGEKGKRKVTFLRQKKKKIIINNTVKLCTHTNWTVFFTSWQLDLHCLWIYERSLRHSTHSICCAIEPYPSLPPHCRRTFSLSAPGDVWLFNISLNNSIWDKNLKKTRSAVWVILWRAHRCGEEAPPLTPAEIWPGPVLALWAGGAWDNAGWRAGRHVDCGC